MVTNTSRCIFWGDSTIEREARKGPRVRSLVRSLAFSWASVSVSSVCTWSMYMYFLHIPLLVGSWIIVNCLWFSLLCSYLKQIRSSLDPKGHQCSWCSKWSAEVGLDILLFSIRMHQWLELSTRQGGCFSFFMVCYFNSCVPRGSARTHICRISWMNTLLRMGWMSCKDSLVLDWNLNFWMHSITDISCHFSLGFSRHECPDEHENIIIANVAGPWCLGFVVD